MKGEGRLAAPVQHFFGCPVQETTSPWDNPRHPQRCSELPPALPVVWVSPEHERDEGTEPSSFSPNQFLFKLTHFYFLGSVYVLRPSR